MQEIGEKLRRAREERGISLAEIQNSTKIRLRYLEALERGEFTVIPGEVYVRGFLQNFASAVGLDPRELLEAYDRCRGENAAEPAPDQVPVSPPAEPVRRRIPRWGKAASLCAAAVLTVSLVVWSLLPGDDSARRTASPDKRQAGRPPAVAGTRAVQPRPQPAVHDKVRVVLRFTGRCWLQVRLDGRLVFSETVNPGVLQTWQAEEVAAFDFGNAGGVTVEVNGKPLGYLGKVGENLHREFRRDR